VKIIAKNKKAAFNFSLLRSFTAGIILKGTEVKALREGRVNLDGAYARVIGGEVFLYDVYIGEYSKGTVDPHDPDRRRKLLLTKREIHKIQSYLNEKGITLIPVSLFFNEKNLAKLEIAVARGKSKRDKRQDMKKREAQKHIRQAKSR
jgi:SsrA-binding protein